MLRTYERFGRWLNRIRREAPDWLRGLGGEFREGFRDNPVMFTLVLIATGFGLIPLLGAIAFVVVMVALGLFLLPFVLLTFLVVRLIKFVRPQTDTMMWESCLAPLIIWAFLGALIIWAFTS